MMTSRRQRQQDGQRQPNAEEVYVHLHFSNKKKGSADSTLSKHMPHHLTPENLTPSRAPIFHLIKRNDTHCRSLAMYKTTTIDCRRWKQGKGVLAFCLAILFSFLTSPLWAEPIDLTELSIEELMAFKVYLVRKEIRDLKANKVSKVSKA